MTNPLAAFLTALHSDPALKVRLQEALVSAGDDVPARVRAFAAAEGYAVSDADLAALAAELERQRTQDGGARVLDDSDIDGVSGGVIGVALATVTNIALMTGGRRELAKETSNYFDMRKREFWIGF